MKLGRVQLRVWAVIPVYYRKVVQLKAGLCALSALGKELYAERVVALPAQVLVVAVVL
ncbi:hypothetical protein VU10_00400 [Desulfobulbus sp. US1]|nr:hypothetical protein [Desulfobulbus sp. US4]MCW5204663.1 hypothetical protein [Desulfobulbus sp. N2]MCW5208685.1 hypothetical protein [Desulfobulbus sp. US1]MCW5213767.1 hypothetical protein [Desulfobulbus sp. US5]WLE96857.1 MAG: hypothetical protein QTN59_19535 [Candidatus Electrothrix communis]